MKKHTTYYVIGAVLIGAGIYLYSKKKDTKSVNLNPPAEVNEESNLPEVDTAPYISASDSIKKLIDSIRLAKKESTTTTTINQTV
jgi:hypothetical protein